LDAGSEANPPTSASAARVAEWVQERAFAADVAEGLLLAKRVLVEQLARLNAAAGAHDAAAGDEKPKPPEEEKPPTDAPAEEPAPKRPRRGAAAAAKSKPAAVKADPSAVASPSTLEPKKAAIVLRIRECNTAIHAALTRLRDGPEDRVDAGDAAASGDAWREYLSGTPAKQQRQERSDAATEGPAAATPSNVGGLNAAAEIVAACAFSARLMLMENIAAKRVAALEQCAAELSAREEKVIGGEASGGGGAVPMDVDVDVAAKTEPSDAATAVAAATSPPSTPPDDDDDDDDDDGDEDPSGGDGVADAHSAAALGSMLALKTCQDHRVGAATTFDVMDRCVAALKPSHAENEDAHAALKRTFEELKAELLDDMNDEEDEGEDEEDEGENAGGGGGGGGGGAAGREPPGESPVERVAAGL
jgi:hypothetical protein